MFYRDERLALFIDGANLYAAARALGFDIDYKLLRTEFMRRGKLLRAFYYTALLETEEYSPIRPLVDWLNYNGFAMVTKPAKEFTDSTGRRKVKGNMDIELAVDAMEMAPHVDHIVLFSGDGDFRPLVESLQRQGVRVSVVSTIRSSPPMIADELRRQCDNFIELDELREVIGRPPRGEQAQAAVGHRRRGRMTPEAAARLPALPPARRPTAPRTPPATPTGSTAPVPSFGDPDARLLVARPGAGGGGRQPHRPAVHRRLRRRRCSTRRSRKFGFANGRFAADPDDGLVLADCLVVERGALRAAAEQADAGRDRHLPAVPRRPDRRAAAAARRSLPRPHRARDAAAGARAAARRAPVRARRRATTSTGSRVFDSYHCSRYNTNTGRLTTAMFEAVLSDIRDLLRPETAVEVVSHRVV